MRIVYDLFISLYLFSIKTASLIGNEKAKLWVSGRKNCIKNLEEALKDFKGKERFWFHCASLGEFEQGRALIEKVREEYPDSFILLTFFSPSGYEIRKNYKEVNFVSYLPMDTRNNASKFVNILNPTKTFFIKYEFWFNYINELNKKKQSVYIVSAIFRPQQIFFKWYGVFFREMLKIITHIFVQDKNSFRLLKEAGISNSSISGDTRFDRVEKVAKESLRNDKIEEFIGKNKSIIAGSTWPEDEELLLSTYYSLDESNLKLLFVPHEVTVKRIEELKKTISKQIKSKEIALYSDEKLNTKAEIMIIDTVGLLSSAYAYATLAWVGGGFGKGIHNILEPAAHGKPILFGPEYSKFKEAHDLITKRSAYSISDSVIAKRVINKLLSNQDQLKSSGAASAEYVKENTGATNMIFEFVFKKTGKKQKPGQQQIIEY